MGRPQKDSTLQAVRLFKEGKSISVAAAIAGIHTTTLIDALRRYVKPAEQKGKL